MPKTTSKRDLELLEESLELAQRIPCQFWACQGPTLRPVPMTTCGRCDLLARLAKRLGVYKPRAKRDLSREEDFHVPIGGWYSDPE